ncbi:lactonase family protein [Cytobacillus gottheilii]|uniref:lactonase family protein n=1 Tax=Cytobacillus gottheilii TaxID=859144 RepID=UPI0009B96E5E|nr:lactonase family protein [Cytobacillus gottheilii]
MAKYYGYIGTYTKGESKGIYTFALDTELKKLEEIEVAAELGNPTYLTISKDNRHLYSVVKNGEDGGVAAYSIDENDQSLKLLNSLTSAGSPPCHVSIDEAMNLVLTANYHKGTVESYLTNDDGSLQPASSIMEHKGSGPDSRQEKAHTHYAGMTPDGKYAAAVDLGTDELITYEVQDGKLSKKSVFTFTPGSGPRHLTFHANGKTAYVMTEFSSEVVVLTYSPEDGSFEQIQAIKTIPNDFTENNQGSAIHLSSDNRYVYAGNRGHDTIAVFAVDENTNTLTFVEHTSTYGNWPRDFVLDPSEQFIIASNQNSSNLSLYSRDAQTGKLTLLQQDVAVPDPVCVKFLHEQ